MPPKLLGNVDLLGLNSFGENPGMNPLWGVVIGGSVSGITSTALARTSAGAAGRHADLIGLLAGVAAGGVMWSMKSTRHAAFGAFAGAFFATGLSGSRASCSARRCRLAVAPKASAFR